MNVLKIIRNFISRKPQPTDAEAPTLTVPTGAALVAELNTYEPLVVRAADAEGWDDLSSADLVWTARLQTAEGWYAQLHTALPLIAGERDHLSAALHHIDATEWPLTASEYAVATAVAMLTVLMAVGEVG